MKVLLVGNYETDRQESMLRFADALQRGLNTTGVQAKIIRPESRIGRLHSGSHGLGKWLGYLDKFVLFPPRLRQAVRTADVVHICDHSNAMYVPHVAARPHLVTCNDMLAIRSAKGEFPQNRTGWTGRILQRWILGNLKRAPRLTCISEATRGDVLRLTGHSAEKVTVTHMGLNHPYAPVAEVAEAAEARREGKTFDREVFARHRVPDEPYIIHVGGTQWYKNRAGVLAIHQALGPDAPRLLLIGRSGAALPAHVLQRSHVENDALAALYSGAELLLFPSLEEGFGWPIVEAQACGCRVLTTGKPPMTEVGGEAAAYLPEPENAATGATHVRALLAQDQPTRRRRVAAGLANAARFSTQRMIDSYRAIYEELLCR